MTSNARDRRSILGTVSAADGTAVVRVEDRFDTDVDDLWAAVTVPDRLGRWLGEIEGELRLGGEFRARFHDGWTGTGRVDACEAPRHLRLSMRDADSGQDEPEEGGIEITLTADGEQTSLVWEERGMPTHLLAAYGAGIQVHVEDLAAHVAGRDRGDAEARWRELLPAYAELAGPFTS